MKPTLFSGHDGKHRRLTGGRLAAACLMMLSLIGAMITYLDEAGYAQPDWPNAIIAAAIIGLMAGWGQLGRNLGHDFMVSGLFGLGAGFVGLIFFAMIYGFRSAWITHFGVGFDAPIDVITHVLKTGITVGEAALASPRTLLALGLGSLTSGIIAEFCNRIWN